MNATQARIKNTRLPAHDPIWGYVIESARKWGTDDFVSTFDGTVPAHENLMRLARGYEQLDRCEFVVQEVVRRQLGLLAWDFAKYGESPGGYPIASAIFYVHPDGKVDNRQELYVSFGLCEKYDPITGESSEGTSWFVQLDNYDANHNESVVLTWEEATPERLAAWTEYYFRKSRGY